MISANITGNFGKFVIAIMVKKQLFKHAESTQIDSIDSLGKQASAAYQKINRDRDNISNNNKLGHHLVKPIRVITCCLLLLPVTALASDYFYCTKSSSYVHLGDSVEKVEKLCGKPSATDIVNVQKAAAAKETTRWVYAQMSDRPIGARYSEPIDQESFFIDFQNGVVKDIIIHGQKVTSTNLCSHLKTIAIGDSIARVWASCGSPRYKRLYRNKAQSSSTPKQAFIYRYQALTGTTSLVFEQFKLVKIDP